MNITDLTDEQKRVKIAEYCGWTDCNWYEDNAGPGFWNGYPPTTIGVDKSGEWQANKAQHHKPLPDYLNDLNAMHEAEKGLTEEQHANFRVNLFRLIDSPQAGQFVLIGPPEYVSATARQRADAFLLTLP